jgi:hypothetical protein
MAILSSFRLRPRRFLVEGGFVVRSRNRGLLVDRLRCAQLDRVSLTLATKRPYCHDVRASQARMWIPSAVTFDRVAGFMGDGDEGETRDRQQESRS